ncbi:MAG: peptidoglycan editing factor PgeF [Magnetococcus sp. MYC-9]
MHKKHVSITGLSTKNQETIPLLLPERSAEASGVQVFFTTRRGGVSQGSHASLNLAEHVGDDPVRVARNRAMLEAVWSGKVRQVCYLNQVHGATTVVLEGAPGARQPPNADAWATRQTGLLLAIMTADCAPVLFADATARVIGAAHAGWRGGLEGVLESCLQSMCRLGAQPARIIGWIGPCIRRQSYSVDIDFQTAFAKHGDKVALGYKKFFSEQNYTGTLQFDLPGYLQERLLFFGLQRERIHDVELCTYSENDEFFSHRRSTQQGLAPCGRQIGGIFLE